MKPAAKVALLFIVGVAWSACAGPAPRSLASPSEAGEALRRHGVDPTVKGVLNLLNRWHPDADQRVRIHSAIRQLGSDSFDDRESATRQLVELGVVTIAPLRTAAVGDDPEAAARAARLVADWEHSPRHREDEELLAVGSQWLFDSREAQATPLLLQLLPDLPDGFSREVVGQALWACTGPGDAPLIRQSLHDAPTQVRALIIPSLEIAAGDSAVEELKADLRDPDENIRLAAARALIDRLPHPSIEVLVDSLASADPVVRSQSAWLLQQVSGIPTDKEEDLEFPKVVGQWKAWAQRPESGHPKPLGNRRLLLARYGQILSESFALAAGDEELRKSGYHQFRYETNVDGAARVKDGMLRLEGNHPDGDQRLWVDAERLQGLPQFSRHLMIKVAIGGEDDQAGAWHAGVSVGNIRLLFHPGYPGGAFRAERIDNQTPMIGNQSMPFTPAAGVLHDMSIDVRRDDAGDVTLAVSVTDPADPANPYTHTVSVKYKDIGDMTRIALERSGRPGGAALFSHFSLRQASTEPTPSAPKAP